MPFPRRLIEQNNAQMSSDILEISRKALQIVVSVWPSFTQLKDSNSPNMKMALPSVSIQLQTQFIDWVFNIDGEERLAALLVGCDGLGSELVTTEHSQGFLGLSVTLGHTPGVEGAIGDESLNVGLGGSLDGQATSGSPSSKSKSVEVWETWV